MPNRRSRPNEQDHRQQAPNFPPEGTPREVPRLRMTDIKGKAINRIRDAQLAFEERDQMLSQQFDDQARLRLLLRDAAQDEGNFQLLISIYATGDRTQKQLAELTHEDEARISTELKDYRGVLRNIILSNPEWIATLAPQHQRMIYGHDPDW